MGVIKSQSDTLAISAPTYNTKIFRDSPHWARFERSHSWQTNTQEIDVFGDCWSFAWTNFINDQVSVNTRGKSFFINGACALLIPPFSIIDWQLRGGTVFWQAIVSDKSWPRQFPKKAVLYRRRDNEHLPRNLDELHDFINSHEPEFAIDKEERSSAVALRTKKFIDHFWSREFTIEELSESLGFDHAVIDRAFKLCYGLSPIAYRNKMRVLSAAHRMLLGANNVTDVALEVGFSGVSNFNKQFKKVMRVPPSVYTR